MENTASLKGQKFKISKCAQNVIFLRIERFLVEKNRKKIDRNFSKSGDVSQGQKIKDLKISKNKIFLRIEGF